MDASPSLYPPEPGPSRPNGSSRAASIAVQPSSASSAQASSRQHRASHAIASSPQQNTQGGGSGTNGDSPTRDVYAHPAAVAYAQAHPRRTIPKFGPYLLLQTLGEGEFGKVKLGLHSQWGEEVAVKLMRRNNVDLSQQRMTKVEREIEVLRNLKHPNIVRLYDVIETDKYIGIILEYASGGELFDHILAHRYLKEKDACKLFAQLISGVWYTHQKKIVHRDLKLENLLLDRHRNVIITDFGFANRFEDKQDDLMQTSCGSPCYAAPELVISEGMYVGTAVDIWSCGVILYAMLAGYLPFDDDPANPEGDNINLLYRYIVNTPLAFPDYISEEARDLLKLMLVPDPAHRGTLEQVMRHPWLEPFAHLFVKSVDELERAAIDQLQLKRQAYQRNAKQTPGARGLDPGKVARSQSARPDAFVDAAAPDGRSRSVQPGQLVNSHTQPEFLYDSSVDQTPAANGKRGHQSAMVLPSTQQSPPRLGLDDDPFAMAGGVSSGLAAPTSPDERDREPRARTSSQAAPGSPAEVAQSATPKDKAKSRGGGMRHTIQVEVGEAREDKPSATPDATPERPRRERRQPSVDAVDKALPSVPGQSPPSASRTRSERGPPPSSMGRVPSQPAEPLVTPVVHIAPASPPATPSHTQMADATNMSGGASRRGSHKRGISVDKLGLGKIFGGSEPSAPASTASSRVPSDGASGKNVAGEEDDGSSWYKPRTPSRDAPASASPTAKGWSMGKKPSATSHHDGAQQSLSPGTPASGTSAGSIGKKSRRNTLTVMVEPFSRSLRARKQARAGDVTTPTTEKREADLVPAPSAGKENATEAFVPPSDAGALGHGMQASSGPARKVMNWFRTKSTGENDATTPVAPVVVTSPVGEAAPAEPRSRKESRTPKPPALGPRGNEPPPTPGAARRLGDRVRVSLNIGGTPRKASAASVIRVHHGAVDQTMLVTSPNPPEVMAHMRAVLEGMGVELQVETEYKYRCVRPKRKERAAKPAGSPGVAAFNVVGSAGSGGVDRRGLPLPSQNSFSGTGMLRGLLMRRQSSQVSAMVDPMSPDQTSPPSATVELSPDENTIYGDRNQDLGDEIRFSVELTKMDRLSDMYSIDMRRLKGNLRSYKFVYDTIRDRADLQARQ